MTEKQFLAPRRKFTRKAYVETLAYQIASRWLLAQTTEEREAVRHELHQVRPAHRLVHCAFQAYAAVKENRPDLAQWFMDFMGAAVQKAPPPPREPFHSIPLKQRRKD